MVLFFLGFSFAFGQEKKEIVEMNTNNTDLGEIVSTTFQYVFPEFTTGQVFFRSAPKGTAKLNYNILIGEMQFLSPEDEIMALANVNDVFYVSIDQRKFFPYKNNVFAEEIVSDGAVKLRVVKKGKAISQGKAAAYGGYSSTSSITSYKSIQGSGKTFDLAIREKVQVEVDNFFYLTTDNNKYILIKNQKTYEKLFPGHKEQIEAYVRQNDISFKEEDDLIRLTTYCNSL